MLFRQQESLGFIIMVYIDYHMLRARYRFYSREYHIANKRDFEQVSGMVLKTRE